MRFTGEVIKIRTTQDFIFHLSFYWAIIFALFNGNLTLTREPKRSENSEKKKEDK